MKGTRKFSIHRFVFLTYKVQSICYIVTQPYTWYMCTHRERGREVTWGRGRLLLTIRTGKCYTWKAAAAWWKMLVNKTLPGCIKKNNEENKTFMRRRLGICLTRSDFWTIAFPWCIKFRVRGVEVALLLTINLLILQFLSFCSSVLLLKGFQRAFLLIRDSRHWSFRKPIPDTETTKSYTLTWQHPKIFEAARAQQMSITSIG